MKPVSFLITVLAYWILALSNAFALNQPTHEIVNRIAAQQSRPGYHPRNSLDLPDGLVQRFRGRAAIDWIGEGGIREDDGIRFFRHFHDPLKPWAQAGLGPASSSILWMQRPTDPMDCQEWTWSSARCYFYRALSGATPGDREQAWADTFRAIGQLMHLVVDASVPEHTRSDPHPLGGLFGSYEYWVQSLHTQTEQEGQFISRYLSSPVAPDATLVGQSTNDAAAPVPIARLIDADVYTGVDPNVTLTSAVGIAEFANANFFSEDSGYRRFLAPTYPYPSVERLVPSRRQLPMGRGVRAYYKKGLGDGLEVDPVLAECAMDAAFRDEGIATPHYKCADANVWEQTALAHVASGRRLCGGAHRLLLPPRDRRCHVRGQNLRIAGADEPMVGDFRLLYERSDGTRAELAAWAALRVDPNEPSQLLPTPQLPGDAVPDAPCFLIFRGQLGLESGAVAGPQVACPPVPPPPPPPAGQWYVYYCATFIASDSYFYATTNPPLWDFDAALLFYYKQESTGTGFSCSLKTRGWAEQPPGTRTDHPA